MKKKFFNNDLFNLSIGDAPNPPHISTLPRVNLRASRQYPVYGHENFYALRVAHKAPRTRLLNANENNLLIARAHTHALCHLAHKISRSNVLNVLGRQPHARTRAKRTRARTRMNS